MNERILEFAKKTGLCDGDGDFYAGKVDYYEDFAELIRADEREACAKVCEEEQFSVIEDETCEPYNMGCRHSAAAIRARSNK